ncbi:hypothetical protein ACFORJ_07850 [Corynebacterium hansenii]|uniref:Phage protein Gp19/Gp15/Gp42 n=1 Tax=Corynebacterium hansenii TaxID=394964 RepID=A0ABV7ZNC9_9CORY|nr:hypothetical protein [Corynebacterium hansenii]WJZ00662.1 hypothetical protein CHAN_10305 [Corynebacterium hansenii]
MPRWLTDPLPEVWPDLNETELKQVGRWVIRAEAIIAQRFPTTAARVQEGKLDVGVVAGVIEEMVSRALAKTRRGGMDKLSYPEVSMEWSDNGGAGEGSLLYLTIDELMLLTPPPDPSPRVFSIRKKPRTTW